MQRISRLTLRWKLLLIALVAQAFTLAVSGSAVIGFLSVIRAGDEVLALEHARDAFQAVDAARDEVRVDVYRLAVDRADLDQQAIRDLGGFQRAVDEGRGATTPALHDPLMAAWPALEQFGAVARQRIRNPSTDPAALQEFEAAWAAVRTQDDQVHKALDAAAKSVADGEARVRAHAFVQILAVALLAVAGVLLATQLLSRSIVGPLTSLAEVARQVVRGDTGARANLGGDDEIARLAQAFDGLADNMSSAMLHMEFEGARDRFRGRLVRALEMADEEDDVLDVVRRAMVEIDPGLPMELLLADGAARTMSSAVANPGTTAPGCTVNTRSACVAVRRGNQAVFTDSEALDACQKLRGRASGPCSAVCVPVTFMGRALGVLHAVGPENMSFGQDQLDQLTTLAAQAGAGIGRVRAVHQTKQEALTDGLTGLVNRRALESDVGRLLADRIPFVLAMADLDKFKVLNDTYGHEAGDRALKTFAQVLRSALRGDDIAARLGGEEFVLVFPGCELDSAVAALERLRTTLSSAVSAGQPKFTASFGVTSSDRADSFEGILAIADAALYRAKGEGRDRVVVATDDLRPSTSEPARMNQTSAPNLLLRRRPALLEVPAAASEDDDPRPTGV